MNLQPAITKGVEIMRYCALATVCSLILQQYLGTLGPSTLFGDP